LYRYGGELLFSGASSHQLGAQSSYSGHGGHGGGHSGGGGGVKGVGVGGHGGAVQVDPWLEGFRVWSLDSKL
jgi:hypothetical protein